MAFHSPTTAELWRAEADMLYLSWLVYQQLNLVEHEENRTKTRKARLMRTADGDLQLRILLRITGDAACITHADQYPGIDA